MRQVARRSKGLSRVIPWGHELLAEVVAPGDLVVDLTAGRGQDTLALWRMVTDQGQVIAFDVQTGALEETEKRLFAAGAQVRLTDYAHLPVLARSGIDLINICHSRYSEVVCSSPTAIIANLGYLPGGDQRLITRPETTLAALKDALEGLAVGGRMAVVVYSGHTGGRSEAIQVADFFSALDSGFFDVVHLSLYNRIQAPVLFVVEKRSGVGRDLS